MIPLSERFNEQQEDIRYSKRRKYDVDKLGLSLYNEVRLPTKEYAIIMSEAETWDRTKRNVLLTRTIYIDDVDYTYRYYIDDDAEVHIVGRYKPTNIHERKNYSDNADREKSSEIVKELGHRQGHSRRNLNFSGDGRESTRNDMGDLRSVRGEGDSNGTGRTENRADADRNAEKGVQGDELTQKRISTPDPSTILKDTICMTQRTAPVSLQRQRQRDTPFRTLQ